MVDHQRADRRVAGIRALAAAALVLALTASAPAQPGGEAPGGPGSPEVAELIARGDAIYQARKGPDDVRRALGLYKQAAELDPGSYEAAWKIGQAAWQLAEWVPREERRAILEDGRDWARRATELRPDGVDGHYWYGVLIARVGEERGILVSLFMVDDVMREMETVLRLDPTHAGAHHVLSVLYRKVPGRPLSVGDKGKALEHARLAVRYAPNDLLYLLGLAEAYEAVGDRANAAATLRRVLQTPGDDPANDERYRQQARERLERLGERP